MLQALRRLLLGIVLIAAASATLVLTDRSGPSSAAFGAPAPKRIAVVQISSIKVIVQCRDGLLEHLGGRGYDEGSGTTIDLFNAEGDMGTLAQICAQVATAARPYDLVVTLSTVATQSFMRSNKADVPQVFGMVTSPESIDIPMGAWSEGSARPPTLAGIGSFQPIEALFAATLACDPTLRRFGTVWNPAEPNAEASIHLARSVCAKLGLEMIDANAASVTEVMTATDGVLARGIDCFWIMPDTNAIAAAKPIVERCRRMGVPVVSNFPDLAEFGSAVNYGADYRGIGFATATIADLVLAGTPPREIPIENFVPSTLWLNLGGLGESWSVPPSLAEQAERIIAADGKVEIREIAQSFTPPAVEAILAARANSPRIAAGRAAEVAIFTFGNTTNVEEAYAGFLAELGRLGYEDGRNIKLTFRDAQLDSATLNTIAAAIESERPDVVMPFTTPALQATLRRMGDLPIVFSVVSSGVAAGAGRSASDHLPNVTGAETRLDAKRMRELLAAVAPRVRTVGTVFAPSEANSLFHRDLLVGELEAAGITVITAPADRPTEIPEAADSLVAQGAEIVVQISDNASGSGFNSIVRSADRAGVPVFGFTTGAMHAGATLSVSIDYEQVGALSAEMLDRVLRGESPAAIPFSPPQSSRLLVNPARLEEFGMTLPPEVAADATFTDEAGRLPDEAKAAP